jgi:hypothetical protein
MRFVLTTKCRKSARSSLYNTITILQQYNPFSPCALKGFLFDFNSKEYRKRENVVVCISFLKSLTARSQRTLGLFYNGLTAMFVKDNAKVA